MKRMIVPTLAAMAAFSSVSAVDIEDGDTKLSFGGRFQARADYATGTTAAGTDWKANGNTKELDFYLRRVRFTTKGSYKGWIKFVIDMEADKLGQQPNTIGDTSVGIEEARLTFDFGDHELNFGHYKPFYNMADKISSSTKMFMEDAGNDIYEGSKAAGIGYYYAGKLFQVGVDLKNQNADTGLDGDADPGAGEASDGDWQFTARIQSGFKEEWAMKKLAESHLAKEGFMHNLGLEFGIWTDDDENVGGADEATVITLDYLVHWNQINGGAYFSFASMDDGTTEVDGNVFTLFAGYAIAQDDVVYEPAVRLQLIDRDTDNDNEAGDPRIAGGWRSGTVVDLAVNMYWDGHNNKTQVGLELWSAEEGDGDSTIFRVQHQLNF